MASDGPIHGTWRQKDKARGHEAELSVASGGLASVTDPSSSTTFAEAPLAAIMISDRVGSIPRRLDFIEAGTFETSDNDAIDRLLKGSGRKHTSFVHGLEKFRPRLAIFVVAVIALCFAIYRFAVPVLVEVAIAATPPVVPELMSKSVLASLDGAVFEPTGLSADKQKAIGDGFDQLKALSPRGKDGYHLHYRKGGFIGPNAFALPDGTVILTDELVDMAKDDEMILGVLAHEIGHVDYDHSLRQLYRAAGVTALIMMIGGDIGSGTEDLLVQGTGLLALSHSRSAETQADRNSVELMYKAGKDPAAIVRFFELIRDKFHDTSNADFFSTHPATPERIEETKRYAEEVKAKGS
ncbi:MAG TPA: M48 family metallopeptidase [Rhizobiaceae bacterium]|nr:M48 family metallopeptidase [Rhizobiaceae bacterium]